MKNTIILLNFYELNHKLCINIIHLPTITTSADLGKPVSELNFLSKWFFKILADFFLRPLALADLNIVILLWANRFVYFIYMKHIRPHKMLFYN